MTETRTHLLRLQEAIAERSWTLSDLAREIGLSASQMSRVARGVCEPSFRTATAIARVTGIPVEEWPAFAPASEDEAASPPGDA